MKTLIVATAAAILLGAPLALAASTSHAKKDDIVPVLGTALSEQCTALGQQFDAAKAMHKGDKTYKEALELRRAGNTLCMSHKDADGIKKIESALDMIGVKPKA